MARYQFLVPCLISIIILTASKGRVHSASFTFINKCDYTVWPGILSNAGTAALATTGFSLDKGSTRALNVPPAWSGRLWGRTLCTTDPTTGRFACATGDCGSASTAECSGGAAPPATLAEFTLGGTGSGGGRDFYDVSLVDGYNLPVVVVPQQQGNCSATGCLAELNGACPSELKVVRDAEGVACRSACDAFGSPEYCCSGSYGNPDTCKATSYSQFFKNACPRAYSYAYDDASSTFTCSAGGGYAITFCPSTTSQKSSDDDNPEASSGVPLINATMVYLGGNEIGLTSLASPRTAAPLPLSLVAVSWLLLRLF